MKIIYITLFSILFITSCKIDDGINNGSQKCESNNDCEDGQQCTRLGDCVSDKKCLNDNDCNVDGEICNLDLNVCLPKGSCENDRDCKGDLRCVVNLCVGCEVDSECQTDKVCVNGACVPPQNECDNIVCEPGTVCNPLTAKCEGVENSCTTSEDCKFGLECVNNECAVMSKGCEEDSDCKKDLICRLGVCTGCKSDQECNESKRCTFGACLGINIDLCTNVECERRELCDPQTGQCYPESGDCGDNNDCKPGTICESTLCMGCTNAASCHPNQTCLYGACVNAK